MQILATLPHQHLQSLTAVFLAMNDHVAQQELEQRNRLPTLMEVLGRRTLAPVDLFSFYIYMRDQQRSVDYLDFW